MQKISQIWRNTLQINTHYLAVNIVLVMQGREQMKNFGRVKKNQVLYLITWVQSSNNVNIASFIVRQEIVKRVKPYTDGKYIKSSFINHQKNYSRILRTKRRFWKKIKELPLSAKTVKDRSYKMFSYITNQQFKDHKLVSALSIAVDEYCDINYISIFV